MPFLNSPLLYGAENLSMFKALSSLLWSITHQELLRCTKSKKKKRKKSLGGNSFSWMILWSWKHLPEAEFSLPRINLASVLQLPARDGASQSQHGVFELISGPSLPLSLPWVAALRGTLPTGLWGADKGPACFLGAQVQRFLENNRIKYLKSPIQLLWILCEGTSSTYLPGHFLDIPTGCCISNSREEVSGYLPIKVPE